MFIATQRVERKRPALRVPFRNFMTTMLSATAKGSRQRKTRKKQIAMIAQKVVDANQTHRQGGPSIALANAGTATFRALLSKHQFLSGPDSSGLLCCDPLLDRRRAFNFSISRSIFSVPARRTSSFTTS